MERSYCDWIKRFVKFHNMTSRQDLENGEQKIKAFLAHLAVKAYSTGNPEPKYTCIKSF
jgi:hypothetical protein